MTERGVCMGKKKRLTAHKDLSWSDQRKQRAPARVVGGERKKRGEES